MNRRLKAGASRPKLRGADPPPLHPDDRNSAAHQEEAFIQLTADSVETVTFNYLWAPWIAFGHLTLIEGDEGVGKSMFLAALAADATGGPRLDGGRRRRPGRWVLYLAGEESLSGGVVPRLRAAGAQLDRVSFGPRQEGAGRCWRPQLPTDLPHLATVVKTLRPALLILEPLVSFFGPAHDWRRDQDVHAVLDPLVLLAAEGGCAVVAARHWTKAAAGPALARGMGSRAVSGCAAVVIQLARQDGPGGCFALCAAKYRLGPVPGSRAYSIVPAPPAARLNLGDAVGLRVEDLTRTTSPGGAAKLLAARQLLRNKLGSGWLPAAELVAAGKREGISDSVLYEAKVMDLVQHRWNTKKEPKCSEWGAPKGGWGPLDNSKG